MTPGSNYDSLFDGEEVLGWQLVIEDPELRHEQVSSDPAAIDTDDDGLSDANERNGWEISLPDFQRHAYANPQSNDTDGDGLTDFEERFMYDSDPASAQTFGDRFFDAGRAAVVDAVDSTLLDPPCPYAHGRMEFSYVMRCRRTDPADPANDSHHATTSPPVPAVVSVPCAVHAIGYFAGGHFTDGNCKVG